MLKISIVMLTTVGFAALLIWDLSGPVVSAARRHTVVAVNAQAATQQTQPGPSPVGKPIVQPNSSAVAEASAVAPVPDAPTASPTQTQLATSSHGVRDRAVAHRHLHMASLTNVAHHARRRG